jgi:hypothetical protein
MENSFIGFTYKMLSLTGLDLTGIVKHTFTVFHFALLTCRML